MKEWSGRGRRKRQQVRREDRVRGHTLKMEEVRDSEKYNTGIGDSNAQLFDRYDLWCTLRCCHILLMCDEFKKNIAYVCPSIYAQIASSVTERKSINMIFVVSLVA